MESFDGILGAISYKFANGETGHITMFNRGSCFQEDHLSLGSSTKDETVSQQASQSGMHGEGAKIAALIFVRDRLDVKIRSDGRLHEFLLDAKDKLTCNISDLPKGRHSSFVDVDRTIAADFDTDTMVTIGEDSQGVRYNAYKEWLAVHIEFNPPQPEERFSCEHGERIDARRFSGNRYLFGLLLKPRCKRKGPEDTFAYAYNFYEGETDRERCSMLDHDREEDLRSKIFVHAEIEKAIVCANSGTVRDPWYRKKFMEMFFRPPGKAKKYSDARLSKMQFSKEFCMVAYDYMQEHLKAMAEAKSQLPFYHWGSDQSEVSHEPLGIFLTHLSDTHRLRT